MKKHISRLLALSMVLVLTACSSGNESAKEKTTASEAVQENKTSETTGGDSAEADAYHTKGDVILGTAGTTGTYYYVGAAIGNAVDSASELNVQVQSTNGSMENIAYAQSGDITIGMANTDAAYGAYNGELSFSETGKQDILQIATLYNSCVHMYTRADSGIKTWEDLRGKKVSLGASGTSYVTMCQILLGKYGINWETDLGEVLYLDTGEGAQKLADGDIDAAFLVGGPPLAGIEAQQANTQFYFLSIDENVRKEMLNEYSYISEYTMPAGTYSGQDYDVDTLGYGTVFFCSSDVDEDVIYAFVKVMMEQLDTYADTNASTRQISMDTVADHVIPLHPGAEKYYREAGLIQ